MTRDPRAYLADVIEAGTAIQDAVSAISFDDYCGSRLIRSAVEREFMIIGEALKQLSQRNPKLFASIGQGPENHRLSQQTQPRVPQHQQSARLGCDSVRAS